jgi:hypothetical protein
MTRHQLADLPEWALLTFLPLVHTEEVTGSKRSQRSEMATL